MRCNCRTQTVSERKVNGRLKEDEDCFVESDLLIHRCQLQSFEKL